MGEKTIFDIVQEENCDVRGAQAITSKLFRLSLYEQAFNFSRFSRQLDIYATRLKRLLRGKFKSINSIKGNITKELIKPKMTWSNFLRAVMFHCSRSSELQLRVIKGGKVSESIIPIHDNHLVENGNEYILSQTFDKIKSDLNYSQQDVLNGIDWYLMNPRNRLSRNNIKRNSMKGNLIKELSKDKMTWLNFERGLQVIDPDHAAFILILYKENKTRITHVIRVTKPGIDVPNEPLLIEERKGKVLEYKPKYNLK